MKRVIKLFFIVLVSILIVSCASVKQTMIPVNPKPILTQTEINSLDKKEEASIESKYQTLTEGLKDPSVPQHLVSNVFVETDIRAVLMDLATQTGVNIIPDNTVEGSISLTLNNTPLETAFDMIFYSGGYKYRYIKDSGYYIVGKSLPENSSFNDLVLTKTIKTNRGADKILSQLSSYYQPFVKADGQLITITATPDVINRLERDIALIDKTKRQIEITAQFVMVEWDKGTNLGVQWSDVNLSAAGIGTLIKGGANAFSADLASNLTSVLSANGYNTKIKTVAEPRVTVEDGEKAELNITEEHLFLILSGGGAAYNYFTTKEVEVGIKLKVQPFVTRDGKIRLDINPEVADIIGEREFKSGNGPTQKLPIIARRSTQTTLNVANGETIAIGGLITKLEKTKKSGIPLFRSIPLIGFAFGRKENQTKDVELVIFITSKVIG